MLVAALLTYMTLHTPINFVYSSFLDYVQILSLF